MNSANVTFFISKMFSLILITKPETNVLIPIYKFSKTFTICLFPPTKLGRILENRTRAVWSSLVKSTRALETISFCIENLDMHLKCYTFELLNVNWTTDYDMLTWRIFSKMWIKILFWEILFQDNFNSKSVRQESIFFALPEIILIKGKFHSFLQGAVQEIIYYTRWKNKDKPCNHIIIFFNWTSSVDYVTFCENLSENDALWFLCQKSLIYVNLSCYFLFMVYVAFTSDDCITSHVITYNNNRPPLLLLLFHMKRCDAQDFMPNDRSTSSSTKISKKNQR